VRGLKPVMRLSDFVREHPDCVVGRPKVALSLTTGALAAFGMVLMALLALRASATPGSAATVVLCAALALAAAAGLVSRRRRLREVLAVLWRGTSCYAISNRELILITAVGSAVVIELSQVARLEIDGDELRLATDSELQGLVYAAMFDLFDGEAPRPSAERFFERLAPKVRQRAPNARILRRSVADHAFVTSRPSSPST
jgi:hypothetical protein